MVRLLIGQGPQTISGGRKPGTDKSPMSMYQHTRHDMTRQRRFVPDNLSLMSNMFDIPQHDKNWIKLSLTKVPRRESAYTTNSLATQKVVTDQSHHDVYAGIYVMSQVSYGIISKLNLPSNMECHIQTTQHLKWPNDLSDREW